MQAKVPAHHCSQHESFDVIFERARSGDNGAMLQVLDLLQPEMERMACFIKMPREESIQEIKSQLIELIRKN